MSGGASTPHVDQSGLPCTSTDSSIHTQDSVSHLFRTATSATSAAGGGTSAVSSPAASLLRHVETHTQPSTSTTPSSTTPLPFDATSIGPGQSTATSSPHLSHINPLTHPLYTSLFPPADLPIANISRIMKRSLPENAKIAKDAKECVQDCVSELISFVTSEASDKCAAEKRKTINGDDILYALRVLGFDNYEEVLKVYLSRYRMAQETNPRSRKRSHKTSNAANEVEDHDDADGEADDRIDEALLPPFQQQ